MPYKYFDCSINNISNNNHNSQSFGPVENDIMKDLKLYSILFNFIRTYNHEEADVFITNTIYPEEILEWSEKHHIPKIKRMDGIYWQNDLIYKNDKLNEAALQADHVIFISEYSKDVLKELYGYELNNSVILNNADDSVFFPREKEGFSLVTSCTNWERDGKRINELIEFSKNINDKIHLIGHCDRELPKNIIKHGYIESQLEMSRIISKSNIFISLFFRDAGSKVTCQAIKCGLPVLYTTSGGLKELVKGNGVPVIDDVHMDFRSSSPPLNIDNIILKYKELKEKYNFLTNNFKEREPYYYTIENYFRTMKNYL
jgi:glycosyltransferase involved in cell wall biosynthesis